MSARAPTTSADSFNQSESTRPADIPANRDPQKMVDAQGDHYQLLHWQQLRPGRRRAGQRRLPGGSDRYIDGPLYRSGHKYDPANIADGQSMKDWEKTSGGGSHTTFDSDIPGLQGGTYVAQRLGIDSLSDVP